VEIQLTSDQVLAMAPDASAAAAGKKHGNVRLWKNLGMSASALWGECQGSALYQVKVELASLTSQCSCPSRKLPCKHSLGLLMLAATDKAAVPVIEPPEWVTSWLAKRQASAAHKQERMEKRAAGDEPSADQLKTAEKRMATVKKGLGGVPHIPSSFPGRGPSASRLPTCQRKRAPCPYPPCRLATPARKAPRPLAGG